MLMLDQLFIGGVPGFSEINVLAGLVSPYALTDKISEKFIRFYLQKNNLPVNKKLIENFYYEAKKKKSEFV
jgi:hypothetical protein